MEVQLKIAKRKITAEQFRRIDHGPVKLKTANGMRKLDDGDWKIQVDKDSWVVVPELAMDWLCSKSNDEEE